MQIVNTFFTPFGKCDVCAVAKESVDKLPREITEYVKTRLEDADNFYYGIVDRDFFGYEV